MFLIALAVLTGALLIPAAASAHMGFSNWGMMGGWGMWGFGMILFWLLVILFIMVIIRWSFWRRGGMMMHHGQNRSLDILKERYAKGEITKEQYESMKKDLMQ